MINISKKLVILVLASALASSCQPANVDGGSFGFDSVEDGNSSLKQFESGKTYKCDINQARIAEMKQKWDGYLSGSDALKQRAHEVLSRLPNAFMEWMFTTHKLKIRLTGFGGGGLTYSSYRNGIKIPTGMNSGVRSQSSNWDAFPHETGHAVEGYFWKKHSGWRKELESVYSSAIRSEGSLMKNYAKKNPGEFFAEAFDQYYCSSEARQQFEKKFPMSYAFMKKYMIDPTNLSGTQTGTPNSNTEPKLYVAIGKDVSGSYANTIYFSAPSASMTGEFFYCTAGEAKCKTDNTIWKTAKKFGEANSQRVFKSDDITITDGMELVMAVHTVNSSSIWQTVKFSRK